MNVAGLNWRNADDYPGLETTPRQWAWEFLRRNPKYRADWAKYQERAAAIRKKYGDKLPSDQEPVEFGWLKDDPLGTPLSSTLARKWGLADDLTDPRNNQGARWSSTAVTQIQSAPDPALDTPVPAIEFDLRLPLEPQLERVRVLLTRRQASFFKRGILSENPHKRNRRSELFRNYLRALDAIEETATVAEIGETLFPTYTNAERQRDKKVRGSIKAARILRDSEYRVLPTLSISPVKKN